MYLHDHEQADAERPAEVAALGMTGRSTVVPL
jgi:hypothetical protein